VQHDLHQCIFLLCILVFRTGAWQAAALCVCTRAAASSSALTAHTRRRADERWSHEDARRWGVQQRSRCICRSPEGYVEGGDGSVERGPPHVGG
jgi:hypothetical protein